jgi:hypothetical protein
MMYNHPDLDCTKITYNITSSSTKPVMRVVGWSMVGGEVSLTLAQYLDNRDGKDNLVSDIIDQYNKVHIMFGKNIPMGSTCPSGAVVEDEALPEEVSAVRGGNFGVDFMEMGVTGRKFFLT